MRRQTFKGLILASVILLTGCSQPPLRIYSVIEESDNGYLLTDGNFAYEYQAGEITPLGNQYVNYTPIKPLTQFDTSYALKYADLASYTGALSDAIGYTNYLLTLDYELVSKLYNSTTYDVLLRSSRDEIRILYLGGDTVRIFYKNFLDGSLLPPYTNGKEE